MSSLSENVASGQPRKAGLDALHLHVGALDDANRDRRAAGGDAAAGPVGDPLLRGERVGNVRLQRDAGAHLLQARPVERSHERLGGDFLVAVLLHVEVDELGDDRAVGAREAALGGGAVEQLQPVAQHVHRVLASQRGDLRVDRRDLDRDDFDLRPLQGREVRLQAALGLGLAEQRLAEVVDVHPQPFAAALLEMLAEQLLLGRQHDVGRLVLHLFLDQRHGHAGQVGAEGLEAAEQRAVERAEEPRHALHVEDVDELVGRAVRQPGAERLVGDFDERRLVAGRLDHAVELGLLAALGGRLQLAGALLQAAGQADRLLDGVAERRVGIVRPIGEQGGDALVEPRGRCVGLRARHGTSAGVRRHCTRLAPGQ